MLNILYDGEPSRWDKYQRGLLPVLKAAGIAANFAPSFDDPAAVDYILYCPDGVLDDFTPYTNVKLVQSLWAGVEAALQNKTLYHPVARMVEVGLTQGMIDYVIAHVMRIHNNLDRFILAAPGEWDDTPPSLTTAQVVGFLGLGTLGMICAERVANIGFQTIGWARGEKSQHGLVAYTGTAGLRSVLSQSDILVLLLPHTPQTRHIINKESLALMKPSASIINVGRGGLIDDTALLAALDNGRLHSATLDVFDVEPLDVEHPYWAHDSVLVTPHVASCTRIETACDLIVENIRRTEAGEPPLHLVDKEAGY